MKKKLTFIGLIILYVFLSLDSKAILYEWGVFYNGPEADVTLNVVKSTDGNFCVTGTTVTGSGTRLILRCYSDAGVLVRNKLSNITLPGQVLNIVQDDAPNTYVVCVSGSDTVLMKFNPAMKHKWSRSTPGRVANLRLSSSGDPVIGGIRSTGLFAARYKHGNGHTRFIYNHTSGSGAGDVVIDNADNIYVGGEVGIYEQDMNLIKLTGNGVLIWDVIYAKSPSAGGRDRVYKLAVDPFENVYVFGELQGYGLTTANISASKFTSTGAHVWDRHVATAGGCCGALAHSIVFDPSWNPIFLGVKYDFYNVTPLNETSRIFVNKIDKTTGEVIYFTHPDDIPYSDPMIYSRLTCVVTGGPTGDIYIGGTNNIGGLLNDRRKFVTRINQNTGLRSWSEGGYDFSSYENRVNSILLDGEYVYVGSTEINGSSLQIGLEKYWQLAFPPRLAKENISEPEIQGGSLELKAFPNPFSDNFKLILKNEKSDLKSTIQVFDLSGRIVDKIETNESEIELGEHWETGVYLINVISEGKTRITRIVKHD
jgi:hypothetical protein